MGKKLNAFPIVLNDEMTGPGLNATSAESRPTANA
jgi:hypothetical protein